MDSGMTLEHDVGDGFDPLAPLLPEELCWMLDRSFACEVNGHRSLCYSHRLHVSSLYLQMEWHAGNTLSQSVFTFLYIHHLADINPDLLPPGYPAQRDPRRPFELITVVLRAAVFGMLKSCDLVWRELSKKRVFDVSTSLLSWSPQVNLTISDGGLAR